MFVYVIKVMPTSYAHTCAALLYSSADKILKFYESAIYKCMCAHTHTHTLTYTSHSFQHTCLLTFLSSIRTALRNYAYFISLSFSFISPHTPLHPLFEVLEVEEALKRCRAYKTCKYVSAALKKKCHKTTFRALFCTFHRKIGK